MKKSRKTDRKPPVEEKVVHEKKHLDKPWRLETMLTDPESHTRYHWVDRKVQLNIWIRNSCEKFLSLEHAVQQLNKIARTYNFQGNNYQEHYWFRGRQFRLVHVETEQIVPVIIGSRDIWVEKKYAEREEDGDSAGSPG